MLLAAPGCLPMPVVTPDAPPVKTDKDAAPLPPVRAEEITDKNAHAKAKALQAELDRELNNGTDEMPVKVRP